MRFGLVGLGWAARGFHVPGLKLVPGAEIAGGADASPDARADWAARTGVPAFETVEELVERTAPDIVIVGTPPDSHADLCIRALEAGAHVICEKPFVSDVAEAERVIAAAAAAGRRVAVNHQYREMPIFRAVKERIGTEGVGRAVFCQLWQLMSLAPWDEPTPWRREMPTRTLFEGGVHLVDLLLHFYEELPEAVYARHSPGLDPERTADAIHLVTVEFPGGRLAQITIDRLCPAGTRYLEVRVDCEEASLRASHGGRALLQAGMKRAERPGIRLTYGLGGTAWMERGPRRTTIGRSPRDVGASATGTLFRKIAAAFAAGEDPPSSAREARDALRVIEAAYRSAATGQRVALGSAVSA